MRGSRLLIAAASAAFLAGCGDSPSDSEPESLVESVRQMSASFTSTSAATSAGYVEDPLCVVHPGHGAMGHHWINQDLIDPEFDPMLPEVLLYEPTASGGRVLTGVEYIVINVGQPRPEFDGHPFDIEGVPPLMAAGVPHWSLHVWVHRDNPSGIFEPFNPNVTCP